MGFWLECRKLIGVTIVSNRNKHSYSILRCGTNTLCCVSDWNEKFAKCFVSEVRHRRTRQQLNRQDHDQSNGDKATRHVFLPELQPPPYKAPSVAASPAESTFLCLLMGLAVKNFHVIQGAASIGGKHYFSFRRSPNGRLGSILLCFYEAEFVKAAKIVYFLFLVLLADLWQQLTWFGFGRSSTVSGIFL